MESQSSECSSQVPSVVQVLAHNRSQKVLQHWDLVKMSDRSTTAHKSGKWETEAANIYREIQVDIKVDGQLITPRQRTPTLAAIATTAAIRLQKQRLSRRSHVSDTTCSSSLDLVVEMRPGFSVNSLGWIKSGDNWLNEVEDLMIMEEVDLPKRSKLDGDVKGGEVVGGLREARDRFFGLVELVFAVVVVVVVVAAVVTGENGTVLQRLLM
ncbi:hypothetical protein QVD17_19044 [Tagetes erecta]|uniref:Uncharacterized protein n=1 Tax=Tagetes erecta TaxID=13708 RepID=A0AAD8NWW5_TARER|nr:hypothetical protein QVD17_19044 [Tagetes erecta]